jgi:hypothetical protein
MTPEERRDLWILAAIAGAAVLSIVLLSALGRL